MRNHVLNCQVFWQSDNYIILAIFEKKIKISYNYKNLKKSQNILNIFIMCGKWANKYFWLSVFELQQKKQNDHVEN